MRRPGQGPTFRSDCRCRGQAGRRIFSNRISGIACHRNVTRKTYADDLDSLIVPPAWLSGYVLGRHYDGLKHEVPVSRHDACGHAAFSVNVTPTNRAGAATALGSPALPRFAHPWRDQVQIVRTLSQAVIALGTLAAASTYPAAAIDISGAGATFPYPIYAKWAGAYKKETGVGLNYQSIGSGGGIKQIKAKTVTFGASDAPLPGKELDEAGLAQFPMVMGAIVPVVNLEGIKPGELSIDGPTLARIFLGEIKKWDDPAIAKLNPGAKLPSQAIALVHRSDGSGTTFNFTYYLSDVSPDWKSKVGTTTAVRWPAGCGATGQHGLAKNGARPQGRT